MSTRAALKAHRRPSIHPLFLAFAALSLAATGCSSVSSGDGDADADADADADSDTITISGSLSVETSDSTARTDSRFVLPAAVSLRSSGGWGEIAGNPRSTLSATQCGDGYFYQIYCMAFSDPIVTAMGEVDCTADGAFTVSGLPSETEIGCFVRRAETEDGDYSTVGTIELPASDSLVGTEGSFVASGDMQFNVTLGSDGSITAEVVEDGRSTTEVASTFDTDMLNGKTYSISCATGDEADAFDPCEMGPEGGGTMDFYVHQATFLQDLDDSAHGGPKFSVGDVVPVITVWETGKKDGGDGFTSMGGLLSWDTSAATDPVVWASGSLSIRNPFTGQDGAGGISLTLPSMPGDTNAWSDWYDWIDAIANATNVATAVDASCPSGMNSTFCRIHGLNAILGELSHSGQTVPMASVQVNEEFATAVSPNLNSVRIFVAGLRPDYNETQWTNATDYSGHVFHPDGPFGPAPATRKVVSPLELKGDTASFRFEQRREESFNCVASSTGGSHEVVSSACNGHQAVSCSIRQEMRVDLREHSSTVLRGVVTQTGALVGAGVMGEPPSAGFEGAYELCKTADLNLAGMQQLLDFTTE